MAICAASSARADDAAPPAGPAVPAAPAALAPAAPVAEPPPAPPPGPGLIETPAAPPAVEPGSAPGLVMTPPTVEERSCAADQCLRGTPETIFPLFEPTSRLQIPYTGTFNPRYRNWNVFAGESLTYDSNIFASQYNVQDDWISNTSLGASYRQEGSTFWALATASLTYSAYFQHTEEDALNLYGNFQFGWKGSRFYASVEDQVGYLQNPIVVRDNTFLIIDQSLDSYWINTLTARVGYECARYRAELSYTSDLFNAGNGVISAFDNNENTLMLRGDYYISEKTSVGAYVEGSFLSYSDATQSDYNTGGAGATFSWRPLAKLGVQGTLGGAGSTRTTAPTTRPRSAASTSPSTRRARSPRSSDGRAPTSRASAPPTRSSTSSASAARRSSASAGPPRRRSASRSATCRAPRSTARRTTTSSSST